MILCSFIWNWIAFWFVQPHSGNIAFCGCSKTSFWHNVLRGAIVRVCALALGVLKTRTMWSPCCVGSVFVFYPHARWECHFCICQHLCGGNARKRAFLKIASGFVTLFFDFWFSVMPKHDVFFVMLQQRRSHLAWGSHFWVGFSIADSVRCSGFTLHCRNVFLASVGITFSM